MRKLLALVAVLGFASYAQAGDGTDFTQSGDFRVQYQHDMNTTYKTGTASDTESINQRLRWAANWRVGERMSAHLKLVDNATWGENPDQVPTGRTGLPTTNQVGTLANVATVQEAYGVWQASDSVMIKYGRSGLTLGDGRFLSTNDYEPVNNAFDGVVVKWDQEMFRVMFAAMRASNASSTAGNPENDSARFYGVAADWKTAPDFLKTVSAHYMVEKVDEGDYLPPADVLDPVPSEDSQRIGVTVAGDKMGFDYRANYEMYTGTRKSSAIATTASNSQDIDATMLDAEIGYSLPSLMGLRAHVLYHTDSGSSAQSSATGTAKDKTYQGFYYDRHENGGLMGLFSWGNLTYTSVGVSANPRDDINVAVNYYMYSKTDKGDNNYTGAGRLNGTNGAGSYKVSNQALGTTAYDHTPNTSSETALGNEIDVVVTKKYTNNFSINAHYGIFSPGSAIKGTTFANGSGRSDSETEYYLESKLTF